MRFKLMNKNNEYIDRDKNTIDFIEFMRDSAKNYIKDNLTYLSDKEFNEINKAIDIYLNKLRYILIENNLRYI